MERWTRALVPGVLAVWMLVPALAAAESAWVKDELRLNIRTGPGVKYRIVGVVNTGDHVEVLQRGDGWTQVRSEIGEGWIPEGYLQPEPPAAVLLAQSTSQTSEYRGQLDAVTARATELEQSNETLTARDEEQRSKIESLTRENLELRAGARWPEWITGAGILGAGMLMGAILHSITARRSRPRIRL
jgi:SH3 domain protein